MVVPNLMFNVKERLESDLIKFLIELDKETKSQSVLHITVALLLPLSLKFIFNFKTNFSKSIHFF